MNARRRKTSPVEWEPTERRASKVGAVRTLFLPRHLDAAAVTVAQIFARTGARLRYLYDLESQWDHELVSDEMFLVTGDAARDDPDDALDVPDVLGGDGACPPEDSHGLPDGGKGNAAYAALLQRYHPGGAPGGRNRDGMLEVLDEVRDAPNWEDDGVLEPTTFRLSKARDRLFKTLGRAPLVPNPGEERPVVEDCDEEEIARERDRAARAKKPNPLHDKRFYEKVVCEPPQKLDARPIEDGDRRDVDVPRPPPEDAPDPEPFEEPLPEEPVDPDAPRCLNCGTHKASDGAKLKRCAAWGGVYFCGSFCQKQAWIAGQVTIPGKPRPARPKPVAEKIAAAIAPIHDVIDLLHRFRYVLAALPLAALAATLAF